MSIEYQWFVGIDWAAAKNDVCIIDLKGKIVTEFIFPTTPEGMLQMCSTFEDLCNDKDSIAIAIEIPHGAIVECLADKGFHVFSINPKQLDRFRDRHSPAGCKDDKLDAYVLADSLRTDEHCFRKIEILDSDIIILRELIRIDSDLGENKNRITNRLRQQIFRFAPHFLELSPSVDEPWYWEVLENKLNADDESPLEVDGILKTLKNNRIRRISANECFEVLSSDYLHVAQGTVPAARRHIFALIAQLRLIHTQRKQIKKEIEDVLSNLSASETEGENRDAAIIRSMPGVGSTVVATILSESAQAIAECDYAALRAHAGIAPVTKRSGKRLNVIMRKACNGRLRNAMYHWCRVSVQRDPVSKAKYSALRAKGHSHGRSLRTIGDANLRLLFGMLKNRTLYDPEKRLVT